MDAEVRKRRQTLLVYGVPQSQLRRDPSVEPLEDWQTVAAFRRGRQTEQFNRSDVFEQPPVRIGGCVMKLINDHHVEVIGLEVSQPAALRL